MEIEIIKELFIQDQQKKKTILESIPEKIDTITIRFSEEVLNLEKWYHLPWHLVRNGFSEFQTYTVEEGLNLMKRDSEFKSFFYCSLQFEYIFKKLLFSNVSQNSVINTIIKALMQLEFKGFLSAPSYYQVPGSIRSRENKFPENLLKLVWNYRSFITLTELDFAFDYPKNMLRCFSDCVNYETTVYSVDRKTTEKGQPKKKAKSRVICYDRIKKEKKKNLVPFNELEKMPFPQRLEIRRGTDCKYLCLENLKGSFYEVAFRFSPIMAKTWRKYSIAQVPKDQKHIIFNYIQDLASCGKSIQIPADLKKKKRKPRTKEGIDIDDLLII